MPEYELLTDGSPAPSNPNVVENISPSNLLSTSVLQYDHEAKPEVDEETKSTPYSIIASGADRRLNFIQVPFHEDGYRASFAGISDSPILSIVPFYDGLGRKYLAMTNMSGRLIIVHASDVLHSRRDHTKYAVQVAVHDGYDDEDENTKHDTDRPRRIWFATAGWDGVVFIYRINLGSSSSLISDIGEPVDSIKLPTNPECIRFVKNKVSGDLLLLVSRRDATHLYYYLIEPASEKIAANDTPKDKPESYQCQYLGRQNLAPHSNAWISFTPSSFAICPQDPSLLAVATSSLPHMKLMIVRLLIPSTPPTNINSGGNRDTSQPTSSESTTQHETQATQALAELAIQNREDAAILIQTNTMAPQTPYSTPLVVWRPDGSGVWVNGDDGVIRGIEAKTGKVAATLGDGHEPGSKVRSIWAGWVADKDMQQEWLVSGGFDKRLIVWKVQESTSE